MDPLGTHNYYALLGVRPDASPEAIRAAFREGVKRVHPDRIDKTASPLEWEYANQVMAALTRAYSVLRDSAQRAMYDATLRFSSASSASTERRAQHHDPRGEALRKAQGAVVRGSAYFRNLSSALQAQLRQRQAGDSQDSVRKSTGSPIGFYLCLAASVGWGIYVFGDGSSGYEWTWKHQLGYYSASAGAAWLCTASLVRIASWHKSPLRPYFYLTRLHYVVTTLDTVAYWPLWEFLDASVVHHSTNGSYDKSTLSFFLGDEPHSLEFKSKAAVDAFWAQLRQFQEAALTAERDLDVEYYQRHNLFDGVVPENVKPAPAVLGLPKRTAMWSAAAGMVLCLAASTKNGAIREAKWFRHDATSPDPARSSFGRERSSSRADALGSARKSVAILQVTVRDGSVRRGTGVFAQRAGLLITCAHVVEDALSIRVVAHDGRTFSATIAKQEQSRDLAAIQIEADYPRLRVRGSGIAIGAPLLCLGAPVALGLDDRELTVTSGIVSALRHVDGVAVVQTDASINPGNSGGPILDDMQQIVGIVSFKWKGTEGIGFGVSHAEVSQFLSRLDFKDGSARVPAFSQGHPPQQMPPNGEVKCDTMRPRLAPLTLKSRGGESYLVKLVDVESRGTITVFVRGGFTAELDVPLGAYELRYASGDVWYGYEFLFGPETSYAKADRVFSFTQSGREVAGHEITLYKVRDGNLHTRAIPAEGF